MNETRPTTPRYCTESLYSTLTSGVTGWVHDHGYAEVFTVMHVQGANASEDYREACGLLISSLVTPVIRCNPWICRPTYVRAIHRP